MIATRENNQKLNSQTQAQITAEPNKTVQIIIKHFSKKFQTTAGKCMGKIFQIFLNLNKAWEKRKQNEKRHTCILTSATAEMSIEHQNNLHGQNCSLCSK